MKKRKAEALERRGGGSSVPGKKWTKFGSAEKGGSSSRFQGQGQTQGKAQSQGHNQGQAKGQGPRQDPGKAKLSSQARMALYTDGKCFTCQKAGHVARDCPTRVVVKDKGDDKDGKKTVFRPMYLLNRKRQGNKSLST